MSSVLTIPEDCCRQKDGNALLKIETEKGRCETFVCQFNPEDLKINTQGRYSHVQRVGDDSPIVQFMGGDVSTLELELFFDTSSSYEVKQGQDVTQPEKIEATDVSVYTNALLSLVQIEGKVHRPPIATFCWGSLSFGGFAERVGVHYTMFEKGGIPVRAEVSLLITANDEESNDAGRRSPRESPDRTKCIVMTADSSLWDIARREYGDDCYWREIARANQIMNPLEVKAGTHLKVPALD